ncbi:MAG: TauD/TfdA family dioxygenase [Candidatus Binatia bacterium]|nr:TauD/TfdA family dioxygenase [Candidatus Binatia bacterium]
MDEHFRSYAEQTVHYFDRSNEGVLDSPLDVPAAWRGADLVQDVSWRFRLTAEHVAELEAALCVAKRTGRPTGELTVEDFPLTALGSAIVSWRNALDGGRGFVLISGVPVERFGEADAQIFFWGLGLHLGRPGAQNPDGDLLGHVIDTGEDAANPLVRLYRTSSDIAYHCDAADVVGLLCLTKAKEGGLSRIASSVTVWNEVVRRRPDLASRLFDTFPLDIRNEERSGMAGWLPIPPCRYGGGQLRTFYHSDYFRSAPRHADAPALEGADLELLDLYDEIAVSEDVRLDMDLEPGDIQLVSNHTVIHARTGYEDTPDARRHLLRLWLSL